MRVWLRGVVVNAFATGVLAGGATACGNVSSRELAIDAPIDGDGPGLPRACDDDITFGDRQPIPGLATSGIQISVVRLTTDQLALYFGAKVTNTDLFVARRSAIGEPFGTPMRLDLASTAGVDGNPAISADGRRLWFEAIVEGTSPHLYVSISDAAGAFGVASKVDAINSSTTSDSDAQPFETADGNELWFTSDRMHNGAHDFNLWHANASGAGFVDPVADDMLSSSAVDYFPVLNGDRTTIYFASNRTGNGAKGGYEIWTSHRDTVRASFRAPTPLAELNTSGNDFPTWIAPDNCTLYGVADDVGAFVATRSPR